MKKVILEYKKKWFKLNEWQIICFKTKELIHIIKKTNNNLRLYRYPESGVR